MATLAQIFHWSSDEESSGTQETRAGSEPVRVRRQGIAGQASVDPYALRPLPNEEVYLYIKRFDNTRVVRQADPQAGRAAWKAIGASCVAAALLVSLLLPGAYRLLAGYQIDSLTQSREQAARELKTLEYQESLRLNIRNMQEVAKGKEFAPPVAGQVQFLQPKDSVARLKSSD